jgi:hypothetical protein
MNTPEQLLRENTAERAKEIEYERALAFLTHSTKRSRCAGILYLALAALAAFAARWEFLDVDEPMMRSDLSGLVVFTSIVVINLQLGISSLFPSARDVALRNLINERLKKK